MTRRQTYIVFAIVTLVAAFGSLTQTAVNSMLGGIQESFGTPESISQWLTTAYMLVIGITVPLVTHLSRRFSIRTLTLIAICFMFSGAVVAALSPHFYILFGSRVLQAICAGMTLPLTQTIAMTDFPPGKNATAMGIAGIAMGFAPNIGPLVGGVLVDSLGWRSYFWILALVMVVFFVATLAFVPKLEHDPGKVQLDYLSALLSTLGFGGLLMSFSSMAYRPVTDAGIWVALAVGIICVIWFVRRQFNISHPLIYMSIFESRTYTAGFIIQNLLFASYMGITLILPLFIVNVQGLSPVDAGLVFLPATIMALFVNPIAGILSDKFGARPVILVGGILLLAGAIPMAFMNENTPFALITLYQLSRGVGVSTIMGPLNSWSQHKLPMKNMIDGSAFCNTARQSCASFGTAIMMVLVSQVGSVAGYNLALGLSACIAACMLLCMTVFVRDLRS